MSIDNELQNQFTDRLSRKYGELMFITDLAHLFQEGDNNTRRWLIDTDEGRNLRKQGTKHRRRVCWATLVIAKHVLRDSLRSDSKAKKKTRRSHYATDKK